MHDIFGGSCFFFFFHRWSVIFKVMSFQTSCSLTQTQAAYAHHTLWLHGLNSRNIILYIRLSSHANAYKKHLDGDK